LQGLKPGIDLIGFIGTTEVVPCYKALEIDSPMSFSAACEVMPGYRALKGWLSNEFFRKLIKQNRKMRQSWVSMRQ
jgi:hypothetical protein